MPRLIYTPSGTDVSHTFDWSIDDMDSTQAMLVERLSGCNWFGDAGERFSDGNFKFIHALLFVLAKSRGVIPVNTPPEAFVLKGSEFEADLTPDEAQAAYDRLSALDSLDESQSELMAELVKRDDVDTDPAPAEPEDPEAPKA